MTNPKPQSDSFHEPDIVYRLLKRAEIRRSIPSRKSVQENKPDRISDLLIEAAGVIRKLSSLATEQNQKCKLCSWYIDPTGHLWFEP